MDSARFVPPPGWPTVPDGWCPPDNWQPSSSWPPAPSGWVFYQGAYGQPMDAPAGAWRPVDAQPAGMQGRVRPTASQVPPTTARNRGRGRRRAGVVVMLVGLATLGIGFTQAVENEREARLNAFGDSLRTSDCTLDSLLGRAKSSHCAEPTDSQAVETAQITQIAGGAIAVGGLILSAWPLRRN